MGNKSSAQVAKKDMQERAALPSTPLLLTATDVRRKWEEKQMLEHHTYLVEFQKAIIYIDEYLLQKGHISATISFRGDWFKIAKEKEEPFMKDLKQSFESRGFRALVSRCSDARCQFELTFGDKVSNDGEEKPPMYMEKIPC